MNLEEHKAQARAIINHNNELSELAAQHRFNTAQTLSGQVKDLNLSLTIFIGVLACIFVVTLSYHAASLHDHITTTCGAQP